MKHHIYVIFYNPAVSSGSVLDNCNNNQQYSNRIGTIYTNHIGNQTVELLTLQDRKLKFN